MSNEYLEPGSRSAQLYERARRVMPGGNSRTTVFSAPYPAYAAEAGGATVIDVEGRSRIDFVNNYTALIHGHAHPVILEAVQQQLTKGTAMSFPTEAEIRLAETITERVSSIEQLRFTNSGTEAVMMAIQAARAYTGRRKIARFDGCYHGAYLEESPGNTLEDILTLPFNDADAVEQAIEQHAHELAAVIVDPLPHRPGFVDPRPGFLERLSAVARGRNVLLISDEIISFRVGYNGAQQRFGFEADITTLAKIIGGGFPVGAFGGRADVMAVFDPLSTGIKVPHGGTFNANPVTMVAGHAAMSMLTQAAFSQLAALGERIRTGLADLLETRDLKWQVSGQASLFKLHPHMRPLVDHASARPTPAEQAVVERVYAAMFDHGVVLTPELAGCVSTVMTDGDVDALLAAAERALSGAV
jgi:glutamate-1-semialdehyde 2,1-aminomutase